MRAINYDLSIPKYLLGKAYYSLSLSKNYVFLPNVTFSQVFPEPVLNGSRWVKLKSLMSGICGSDLGLLKSTESFSMEPYTEFPFTLGHENVAEIVEVGKDVKNLKVGQKVIINPVMGCEVHERELCPSCAQGANSLCEHFSTKAGSALGPGISLGYHPKTGGGWADYFQAHETQVYPIPESVPLKRAVLADPFCSALQAVAQFARGENEQKTVLIYGVGTLGLLSVAAIRALRLPWKIIVGYRYPFQGELAKDLGADVALKVSKDFMADLATHLGAKLLPVSIGRPVCEGGVDAVFDTVASAETIDTSLRVTKPRGSVILIGTALSLSKVDPTPLWFREINLTGSCMSRVIIDPRSGKSQECYRVVQELLPTLEIEKLVTHEFSLEDYRKAIQTSMSKGSSSVVKVVFNVSKKDRQHGRV